MLGTGAHTDLQRIVRVAEPVAELVFWPTQRHRDLRPRRVWLVFWSTQRHRDLRPRRVWLVFWSTQRHRHLGPRRGWLFAVGQVAPARLSG